MTLVVGLRSSQRIQLLSDTRISHRDTTQIEEVPGRLKVVMLSPDICVAYAGIADHSLDIVRRAPKNSSVEEAVEYFHAAHLTAAGAVDFLVGCASRCSLFSIRDGKIEAVEKECWIGDGDAFNEYQRRELTARIAPGMSADLEQFSRAIQAFMNVVQERIVPTVGGLVIRAGSRTEGFCYLDHALAFYPSQTIPSGVSTPLTFGAAAEGGFAYTILVPRVTGVSVVAAHFLQGALGFIYAPLRVDKPIQVTNVSHDGLRNVVLERFGVAVDGPRFG